MLQCNISTFGFFTFQEMAEETGSRSSDLLRINCGRHSRGRLCHTSILFHCGSGGGVEFVEAGYGYLRPFLFVQGDGPALILVAACG